MRDRRALAERLCNPCCVCCVILLRSDFECDHSIAAAKSPCGYRTFSSCRSVDRLYYHLTCLSGGHLLRRWGAATSLSSRSTRRHCGPCWFYYWLLGEGFADYP